MPWSPRGPPAAELGPSIGVAVHQSPSDSVIHRCGKDTTGKPYTSKPTRPYACEFGASLGVSTQIIPATASPNHAANISLANRMHSGVQAPTRPCPAVAIGYITTKLYS